MVSLYRAVGLAELQDLRQCGVLRPGPPSYQGKWFAEELAHAEEWGRALTALTGEVCYLIRVEVQETEADNWFRLPALDRVGPARFAEAHQLGSIVSIAEIP